MALLKCKECGKDISDEATTCPNCGCPSVVEKRRKGISGAIALLVLLAIVYYYSQLSFVSDQGGFSMPTAPFSDPPVVTMQEYNRIRDGMTYTQVRQIIGAAGQELSRNNIAGTTTVMYSWSNANGANMNAMFQNNKLISKAQFGLK